jgi:NADH-quinone oxidoreductase subunit F
MTFSQIYKQARLQWDSLYHGNSPVILVGTATCGRAAGAMQVMTALREELSKQNIEVPLIEVGCIGLCSLEPLVTIIKPDSYTVCYHNVTPQMVPSLISCYVSGDDPCLDLALGTVEFEKDEGARIPELTRFDYEKRLILRHCGYISPEDINHYIAQGGYGNMEKALHMLPDAIIDGIMKSGLRGRGGAGFPTGEKWRLCRQAEGSAKYVICNADEGDPGAFMDRVVLESDPHQVIEGMVIAACAVGASRGFIYIRAEYPLAIRRLEIALNQAKKLGLLGDKILGSKYSFDIEIARGAGAFVSGEETALIQAIEGQRSSPTPRPPYPTSSGLWGSPTLINNVKTFAYIPLIIQHGGQWFATIGSENSKGTALFALAGKLENTGLAEVEMGISLRRLVFNIGGGVRNDKQFKAVQVGGPSGGCLPGELLDTAIDFDSLKDAGAIMGSGGIIVMDEDNCMVDAARFFVDFIQRESCGKCTHCRIGTKQMLMILEDITSGKGKIDDLDLMQELGEDIKYGSLCGLGRTSPNPVFTTIRYFRDEYLAHIVEKRCPALVCKDLIAYYILPEKCERGCEHCKLACPAKAIEDNDKRVKVIDQEKCTKCGSCMLVCPKEYNAVVKLSPVDKVPVTKVASSKAQTG